MNAEQRLALIREVFQKVFHNVASFDYEHLGEQLAYLFGAISNTPTADCVEWLEGGEHDYCVSLFRDLFPPAHEVWHFIEISKE
jgi:hypothetical protein